MDSPSCPRKLKVYFPDLFLVSIFNITKALKIRKGEKLIWILWNPLYFKSEVFMVDQFNNKTNLVLTLQQNSILWHIIDWSHVINIFGHLDFNVWK